MHEHYEEFLKIINDLSPMSSPERKEAVFSFIQEAWKELGEHPDIRTRVCDKLAISHALFNSCVLNPPSIRGVENLYKFLKKGWLSEYLEYTIGNEAPEEFHLWVGLTILGVAMRRNVFIDHFYYQIFPNLYTILVAPPGVCKKTTAAGIGESIAQAADVIRVFSEKITPEALAKALDSRRGKESAIEGGFKFESMDSHGLLYAPELTVFLGREQYNEPMAILLTRLYDCMPIWAYESVKHGKIPLKNIFVSLLGCTTPSELSVAIPSSATGGGLMSRLVIIFKTHTPRCFPVPVLDDPLRKEHLITKLRRMALDIKGQFVLEDRATEWWNTYYMGWKSKLEHEGSGVSEREAYMLLKVAMLLAVSEESGLLLKLDTLQRARAIVASAYSTWNDMSASVAGTDRAKYQMYVYETIRKNGGVLSKSILTKKLYGKMRGGDIKESVDFLVTAKMICVFDRDGTTYYRLTTLKGDSDER